MIGRGTTSNRSVATVTSWVFRAAVSVRPTDAYSGSVKLPIGLTSGGSAEVLCQDRVGCREVCLARGFVDHHQASGYIAGGEDMWRRRAKMGIDLHIAAPVGVHAGRSEIEPGGVCDPADRDDGDGRVDVVLAVAVRVRQPDAGRAGLEALDGPGIREDPDPGSLQRGADGCGNVLVFAH